MVETLSRAECWRAHPFLAAAVRASQSSWDPAQPHNRPMWEGEEEGAALFWESFHDPDLPDAALPPFAGELVLHLERPDAESRAAALPGAVARMLEAVDQTGLAFVQVGRIAPWTSRRRRPPELVESSRRLRALGAGKGFNGALRADLASLGEVLEPLFWMERMDAGYGDVLFAPPSAPFTGSLCQYGNLHLHVYAEDLLRTLGHAADAAGFDELEGFWACGGEAIEGRELRIED